MLLDEIFLLGTGRPNCRRPNCARQRQEKYYTIQIPNINVCSIKSERIGCNLFACTALQLEAPCSQWSFFLLTIDNLGFSIFNWSFFAYKYILAYSWTFFAYNGKVRLIRTLRDCKQRSLTVSKRAATVSKNASPEIVWVL